MLKNNNNLAMVPSHTELVLFFIKVEKNHESQTCHQEVVQPL